MKGHMETRKSVEHLVRRAQEGDQAAFDELAKEHRERLVGFIYTRLGGGLRKKVEGDDIAQETLLKAFRLLNSFEWRGGDSFFRWLEGIAEHLILDLAARQQRRRELRLERDVRACGVSASKALRREERFHRLKKAIETLSPEHREVILLARIEGLPVSEIAMRLNRSPNAVAQLLWRALRKLRQTFGDTESLHLPQRSLTEEEKDED
jgi:RNA polymerase sigma-70 factor (ECF subfamily)